MADGEDSPGLGDDRAVLQWVRDRVREFKGHLAATHPRDRRTRALLAKLVDVRLLERADSAPDGGGSWMNGKFKHSTGVLYVAPRDARGRPRTRASLLKTVVHELAHATRFKQPGETSHSQEWKQTWLWFLGVATQELGWRVDIRCAECTFYGLCDRDQCPKCTWHQRLCRPYTRCTAKP